MVMHRRGGQQCRDGRIISVNPTVTENNNVIALLNRPAGLTANAVKTGF